MIHAHFTWPSGYAGVLLKLKYKIPLITTFHGDDVRIPITNYFLSFDNDLLKRAMEFVFHNSNILITHHEELYDLVLTNYQNLQSKLLLIYKGIDLKRFDPYSEELNKKMMKMRESLAIDDDKFIVLFLARLDWDKDPETFVRAANILKYEEDIIFLLVGDGKLKKVIEEYKQKRELNNTLIIGSRSDTEIWYAMCDVFCALSPVENIWSTTLQEALCMGKACIVTKAGYTTRILKHLVDAYLIEPKDPNGLAKAILTLKQKNELRERLEKQALHKWRPKFDINSTIKNLLDVYLKVLDKTER